MTKNTKNNTENILPLYMNGLSGRMLRLPAPARYKREILLVYGHHSSIERMIGVAKYLNKYGAVTMPDLPGFGGMESFYKIGEKPTLDNLADYLAAFVKLRYHGRRFTVIGLSFGFAVITRMLQKYPEIAKKVDIVASIVGFAHHEDFVFKRRNFLFMRYGSSIFSRRLPAAFVQHVALRGIFIKSAYKLVEGRHSKLKTADKQTRDRRINFEVKLWQSNDVRTYMETAVSMFTLKPIGKHIDLPIYHVAIDKDRYFDNTRVEQHMRMIYNDFYLFKAKLPNHAPSVIADAKDVAPLVPPKLRSLLRQKP